MPAFPTPSLRPAGACLASIVLAAAGTGTACAPPGARAQGGVPAIAAAAEDTVFADEFDGAMLDRARWLVYTGRVYNDELQAYVDDTTTLRLVRGPAADGADGGALEIRALARRDTTGDGRPAEFVSARLHGRLSFRGGTVAARMKLPAGAGLWPAFWLLGEGAWPDHGEIDVMENVGDPAWVSVALHGPGYSGDTPLVRRHALPASLDATAWHVYAVHWREHGVTFTVDDDTVYVLARADIARHGPAAAVLDSAKYVVLNLALGGTYPAAVNGVREPRLGLPDATVARVRAGEARLLVDWVRATR